MLEGGQVDWLYPGEIGKSALLPYMSGGGGRDTNLLGGAML